MDDTFHQKEEAHCISLLSNFFDPNSIFFIDSEDQIFELIYIIHQHRSLAIDCEGSPNYMVGQPNHVQIVQISCGGSCFILDFQKLKQSQVFIDFLLGMLKSQDIQKIAFDFKNDLFQLKESLKIKNIEIFNLVDILEIWQNFLNDSLTLSNLMEKTFERPFSKFEQCSDWGVRPLRASQIRYAANDVHSLVYLYEAYRGCFPAEEVIVQNKTV